MKKQKSSKVLLIKIWSLLILTLVLVIPVACSGQQKTEGIFERDTALTNKETTKATSGSQKASDITPRTSKPATTSRNPLFSGKQGILSLINNQIPLPQSAKLPLPEVAKPFLDSAFGTTVTRITDARAESLPGVFPQYAKRQAWSHDESFLILLSGDGSLLLFDGNDYKFIKNLGEVGGEDIFWYPGDSNIILYNYDHILRAYNVVTDESYEVYDFTGYDYAYTKGEGNLSRDGKYYAVVAANYDKKAQEVIYKKLILITLSEKNGKITGKLQSSLKLPSSLVDFDWISISPSGKYIVVDYANTKTGPFNGVEVYDLNFNVIWQKPLGYGHSDLGVDENGEDFLVMDVYNSVENITHYKKFRLSDGKETNLLTVDWSYYQHFSCRNIELPEWCFVSTFDGPGRLTAGPDNWLPFENEIFALKLDGSGEVRRIAHHYSRRYSPQTPDSDTSVYFAEPHATVSQGGDRILFASNWSLNVAEVEAIDTFVVDLR